MKTNEVIDLPVNQPPAIKSDVPLSADLAFVQMVERMALAKDVDVDKLDRLLAMKERVDDRIAENGFNKAMAEAQMEMRPIGANANNPQTKSKYASYAALDRVLRPIYTKHGFALSFDTGDAPVPDTVRVLCYVTNGGHKRTYKADMPADGKGAKGGDVMTKTHAAGSAFTYGARYLLKMIFNVAVGEADDDGNAAGRTVVSAEQVANLQKIIKEMDAVEEKVLAFLKVERLEDVTVGQYDKAVHALEQWAQKKAAKK